LLRLSEEVVMAGVRIRDEKSTGQVESEFRLEDIPTGATLRDLIRTRVREEVARANAAPGRPFRSLVKPVDAEVVANGYVFREPARIDWERQAAAAEEAFLRNGFIVLVGGGQVEELDHELDLDADTEVRFVRLVPLVGG
jgi:hypothetical protein